MRSAISGTLSFAGGVLFAAFGLCAGGVSLAMFVFIAFIREESRTKASQAGQLTEQSFLAAASEWILCYIFPIGFLVVALVSLWLAWESFREISVSRKTSRTPDGLD